MTKPYTDHITSQHRRPKFEATVDAVTAPLVEIQAVLEDLRRAFDLDAAIGAQLDQVGEWVGRSRHLKVPLDGVYFAWDTPGVGWGEGSWRGLYDPASGMVSLPDDVYRQLLKAKVAANSWDGTRDGAYAIWAAAFADQGSHILIQDHGDMTISIGIAGMPPSSILTQLLVQGYIPLKPAGVRVAYYALPPVGTEGALFAWDSDSPALAGWDRGAWPRILTTEV
ncbi:DUF2612 domain-containing protein [Telmatospirillum sp. J64-1]|uniref:DUF2612 domain-containing protein n=1 Tax=Telmatospirillum sp. J64-1 TaxID=2502183 RepID=UPI00163DA59E|nr:DUF2612 domain-containing protein [Telmatospirillum sp. J64-1]